MTCECETVQQHLVTLSWLVSMYGLCPSISPLKLQAAIDRLILFFLAGTYRCQRSLEASTPPRLSTRLHGSHRSVAHALYVLRPGPVFRHPYEEERIGVSASKQLSFHHILIFADSQSE